MKPTLAALALALTVPFTQAANAATVSVEIDTTIFAVVSSRAIPITMGENLVIQFSYDDAVEDTQLTDGFGQFENAVSSLSVVFPDDGLSLTFKETARSRRSTTSVRRAPSSTPSRSPICRT